MGNGISFAKGRKLKSVLVSVGSRKESTQEEKYKSKEEDATLSVSTGKTLRRSSSILFDSSNRLGNLLPDLNNMGRILKEPKVLMLFYRFLKETNWMDEVIQATFNSDASKKNLLHPSSSSLPSFALRFHQYLLNADQESRSKTQQNETETKSLNLLHSLKSREAIEETERVGGRSKTLVDGLDSDVTVGIIAAMGLRSFLLSPEYKKMVSCNWILELSSIKFKKIDVKSPANGRRQKFGHSPNGSSNSKLSKFPSLLSIHDDDPSMRCKKMISNMLSSFDFLKFRSVLEKQNSWLDPISSSFHRLPIAFSIVCYNHHSETWDVEYANQHYEQMMKSSLDEIVGQDMNQFCCSRDNPIQQSQVQQAMKFREPCRIVLNSQRKTGETFDDFVALQPVFDHDIALSSARNSFHQDKHSTTLANQPSSNSIVVPLSTTDDFADLELEDVPSPCNRLKPSQRPNIPLLWSQESSEAFPIPSIDTPSYERLYRIQHFRRCKRYVVVHTDIENPSSKIQDLSLVEDLLFIFRYIL